MRRATCLWLLACLTVGLAGPVLESTIPSGVQNLMDIIRNANSEDNDIDGPSVIDQEKSKDSVTTVLPVTDATVGDETQQPPEAVQDAALPEGSTTTGKIEEPALEPKVNHTETPKEPTELEPANGNMPLIPEEQYPQDLLAPEEQITFVETDEFDIEDEEEMLEGLLNVDDQITPDDEQMAMGNDDMVIPAYEVPSFVPEIEEQIPTEDEVVLVLDERVQFVPNPEEEEMFEGEEVDEEDGETSFQVPVDSVQPEEEIFIVEGGEVYPGEGEIYTEEGGFNAEESEVYPDEGDFYEDDATYPEEIYPTNEEESFMLPENQFMPNTEDQMMPDYDDSEDILTTETEGEEGMPIMGIPQVSMLDREIIVVPIGEEPFISDPEDESIFGSDYAEESPEDFVLKPEVPVYFDTADNTESIPMLPYDSEDFNEENAPIPAVPYFERIPMQTPEYYIPDESFTHDENIENEESFSYAENENDSFTVEEEMPEMNIDVAEVLTNERMPVENDDNTPSLFNILRIKSKPSFSEGNPMIEVISTNFPQVPPQFPFMNEEEPVDSEIPENEDENIIIINDSEVSKSDSFLPVDDIVQQPIFFPEELPPKRNLPVFPNDWREESLWKNIFGPSGRPDFSNDEPSQSFNSYGPSQKDQSTFRPGSFPQFFIKEQSEFMGGMMNDDMQSQMPNTMPFSDITVFSNEDMPENEQPGRFHMIDEVLQNPSYPNVPIGFDSFNSPAMVSSQDGATNQDFRGPNTFPINFRNPNIDRDSMNFNIFDTQANNYEFQGPYQQDQQYDVSAPFIPYESIYKVLRRNKPFRYNFRYPMANQPTPFNAYGSYNLNYPSYDNSYRISSLYSSQVSPLNRYGINQPVRNQFGNFHPFNYPTPLW